MILERFAIEDRVAIVTGSGAGIGRKVAESFAEAGAKVVIAGINILTPERSGSDLENVAMAIRAPGRECLAVPTDVRYGDQISHMVDMTLREFGKVDILVNNAGGSFFCPFLDITENGFDAIIRENLKSVFMCCKAVAPSMIEQGRGSIVNIASVWGQAAAYHCSVYGAAKAGVINLTKTLSVEWARHNIRVNAISPGNIRTEAWDYVRQTDPHSYEQIFYRAEQRSLLGHAGSPEDIAAAALYLVSDASKYVTGQNLAVNGGERGFDGRPD